MYGRLLFLLIAVSSTTITILVAALAAYAFAWMRFPGRDTLFAFVVGLLVVPLQMTLIPILRLFTAFHLTEVEFANCPRYIVRILP